MVRLTRRRKRASHLRVVPPRPSQVNERWSMDFVTDTVLDGRRFRALTVVDNWSRHSQFNEEPRSKLRGITELKQSDLSEIFAGLSLPLHVPFDSLPVGPLSHCRHIVPVAPKFPAP